MRVLLQWYFSTNSLRICCHFTSTKCNQNYEIVFEEIQPRSRFQRNLKKNLRNRQSCKVPVSRFHWFQLLPLKFCRANKRTNSLAEPFPKIKLRPNPQRCSWNTDAALNRVLNFANSESRSSRQLAKFFHNFNFWGSCCASVRPPSSWSTVTQSKISAFSNAFQKKLKHRTEVVHSEKPKKKPKFLLLQKC